MKKKKLIITVIIVGFIAVLGITRMTVAQSYSKKDPKFIMLSKLDTKTYLYYDSETKVEYIKYFGGAYTVRLDKSGNPCIYEGEE